MVVHEWAPGPCTSAATYAVWHESDACAGRSVRPWKEPLSDTSTLSRPGCGASLEWVLVMLRASTSMIRMARLTHSEPLFRHTKPSYLAPQSEHVTAGRRGVRLRRTNAAQRCAPHDARALVLELGRGLADGAVGAARVADLPPDGVHEVLVLEAGRHDVRHHLRLRHGRLNLLRVVAEPQHAVPACGSTVASRGG